MAISKMEKVTILSPKHNEENILHIIQDLQNIEIVNSIEDVKMYGKKMTLDLQQNEYMNGETTVSELQVRLDKVQKALNYSQTHYTSKKGFTNQDHTLIEFEKQIDFEKVNLTTQAILQVKGDEERLDAKMNELQIEASGLEKWQYLKVNPNDLSTSRFTDSQLFDCSLTVKDKLLTEISLMTSVVIETVYESQSRVYIFLVFLKKDTQRITELLSNYSVNVVSYHYKDSPQNEYKQIEHMLSLIHTERAKLREQLMSHKVKMDTLKMTEELLLAQIERQQAKIQLAQYKQLILIRGWIESDRKSQFDHTIKTLVTEEAPIIVTYEETDSSEGVPTSLTNNKLVTPFESLTEMYSLPKYGELDPTALLTPFYMVFFGMMVADAGYGVLMLIGTTVIKKTMMLRQGPKNFINLFQILSIPVIIWGLIYGSFFGVPLPIHLLSTTDDMNTILIISVVFGMIQLLVGLLVNGIQLVKKKQYLKSISEAFAWQGILISIVILVIGNMVMSSSALNNMGILLLILSSLSIILIPVFTNSSKGKGLAKGIYSFYGITGYVGDLVSYTRLMALGIAGGSIAGAFNMLVGFMPPVARFTVGLVLIVFLHALNIFLSLLSAYVHGARLQYVEYFGKFFQGGGQKFSPLKPKEKYIDFKIKQK